MPSESTHPSLLARVRDAHDRAAWDEFERTYGDLIIGYCRSRGLQLTDAEDIRQTLMLSLASAMAGFVYDRTRGRFRSYLGRAVRNAIIQHQTRHSRPVQSLDTFEEQLTAGDEAEPDELWELEWRRHHCRRALSVLRQTEDERAIDLFDRLLAGQSITNVAAAFDMTPAAVRKAKQRVKERLQSIIARQLREEDPSDA